MYSLKRLYQADFKLILNQKLNQLIIQLVEGKYQNLLQQKLTKMHNILANQLGKLPEDPNKKEQTQQQDVDCPQTRIYLWEDDQYQQFQSDYLNQIFPFKINKTSMTKGSKFIFHFLSSSLHFWIQLVQEQQPQSDKLGLKDVKFLQQIFKQDQSDNCIAFRRWGQNFMKKQQFQTQQSRQNQFQPPQGGQQVHKYTRGDKEHVIIKYRGSNTNFTPFKQRFQVLFLFYIDGVSFVNEETDQWVYYVVFQKVQKRHLFVGVLSEYDFKISTFKQRHRISQVFIMPPFQKFGHGKQLLDLVYDISLKNNNCFQITTEVPSFEYQCLRDYKQIQLILKADLIDIKNIPKIVNGQDIQKARQTLLSKDILRKIKQQIKLPGHQIQRIMNILLYSKITGQEDDMARAHFEQYLRQKIIFNRSPFKTRSKLPHITFFGESPQMKQFLLQKARQDLMRDQNQIQQILTETINGYNRVINKLIKLKLLV